jgi:hypothetical protein
LSMGFGGSFLFLVFLNPSLFFLFTQDMAL